MKNGYERLVRPLLFSLDAVSREVLVIDQPQLEDFAKTPKIAIDPGQLVDPLMIENSLNLVPDPYSAQVA